MGFVKGNDGKPRSIKNPLEGSIGDAALDEVTFNTISVTGNISAGNISMGAGNIAVGNLIFPDGSKFASGSWILLESFTPNFTSNATQMVTMGNTPATLQSNFNELYVRLQGPGSSQYHTSTIIPTDDIVANSTVSLGSLPYQNTGDSLLIWEGLSNSSIRITQSAMTGSTGNVKIYGR